MPPIQLWGLGSLPFGLAVLWGLIFWVSLSHGALGERNLFHRVCHGFLLIRWKEDLELLSPVCSLCLES